MLAALGSVQSSEPLAHPHAHPGPQALRFPDGGAADTSTARLTLTHAAGSARRRDVYFKFQTTDPRMYTARLSIPGPIPGPPALRHACLSPDTGRGPRTHTARRNVAPPAAKPPACAGVTRGRHAAA